MPLVRSCRKIALEVHERNTPCGLDIREGERIITKTWCMWVVRDRLVGCVKGNEAWFATCYFHIGSTARLLFASVSHRGVKRGG